MPKITELFAFVAEDTGPDDEGVMAFSVDSFSGPMMMPLIGADMERVESLRAIA